MSQLSYVDYDFDRLVLQLQNRLAATETWKDAYRSSTGEMVIELYAYIANLVLYYVERRAEESYLSTAQLKSSVINLVKLLGYNPQRKVSSTGVVTFTLGAAKTNTIYLPQYTNLRTVAGLNFLLTEGVTIEIGVTSIEAEAIQGTLVRTVVSATGATDQTYTISNTSIENTNLYIYVNGELWTLVDTFANYGPEDKVYKLRTESNENVTVLFGDDIFGKAPALAASILFEYIRTEGVDGNVYELGAINVIYDPVYDSVGNSITDLTVSNTSTFTGGTESEDIESIRYNAPRLFKTGDRLVTSEDFEAFLLSGVTTPRIIESKVWGENEESPPNYTYFNTLKICALKSDWSGLNTTDKANISTSLYSKSLMTVKYEFIAATIVQVVPTMNVVINRRYVKSQAETNIDTILQANFDLGDTAKLGGAKRLSTLTAALEVLPEISYFQLVLEIRKPLERDYDSNYLFSGLVDVLDIKQDSIKVYLGETDSTATLIAHTDADGNLVSDSSLYTGGLIVLGTGYIGIDCTAGASDLLWVRYQQDNSSVSQEGDIVITNSQICRLYNDTADIETILYTDEV